MGFLDEFKKLTHPYDDEDDDFFGSAADAQPDEERQMRALEDRALALYRETYGDYPPFVL